MIQSDKMLPSFRLATFAFLTLFAACHRDVRGDDRLTISNDVIRVGADPQKGAAITKLSWKSYPRNAVNVSDPGRLIQQSYYAGLQLDRKAEGQSEAWSPWVWNPIQGGGIGSWARVTQFRREADMLYSETIPKLWDMPNEEAKARMRQWTTFETSLNNVVAVRCEFISRRTEKDRWGPAIVRPQEIPACYFTRNFSHVRSYLGNGKWRDETCLPGPPWGRTNPPRKAMAFFEKSGQGIAVFSPSSTADWNFGPHSNGLSDDPADKSCMHVAPIDHVKMGPTSTYRFRYWLVAGDATDVSGSLDSLWEKYSGDTAILIP